MPAGPLFRSHFKNRWLKKKKGVLSLWWSVSVAHLYCSTRLSQVSWSVLLAQVQLIVWRSVSVLNTKCIISCSFKAHLSLDSSPVLCFRFSHCPHTLTPAIRCRFYFLDISGSCGERTRPLPAENWIVSVDFKTYAKLSLSNETWGDMEAP